MLEPDYLPGGMLSISEPGPGLMGLSGFLLPCSYRHRCRGSICCGTQNRPSCRARREGGRAVRSPVLRVQHKQSRKKQLIDHKSGNQKVGDGLLVPCTVSRACNRVRCLHISPVPRFGGAPCSERMHETTPELLARGPTS